MAGDWKIRIDEGAAEFAIIANAKFNLSSNVNYNDAGVAQSVETNIEVEGDIADLAFDEEAVADGLIAVRDQVVAALSGATPVELRSREGRELVKEDIKSRVNDFLYEGQVMEVYFSSFYFQANTGYVESQ